MCRVSADTVWVLGRSVDQFLLLFSLSLSVAAHHAVQLVVVIVLLCSRVCNVVHCSDGCFFSNVIVPNCWEVCDDLKVEVPV